MATWTINEAAGATAESIFSDIFPEVPRVVTSTPTAWAIAGNVNGKNYELRTTGRDFVFSSDRLDIHSGVSDNLSVSTDGVVLTSITNMGFDWKGVADIGPGKDLEDYFFSGSDLVVGNSFSNNLMAFDGDDTIRAGGGNDFIDAGRGSDNIHGEAGVDTAGFAGARSQFVISGTSAASEVRNLQSGEVDRLTSVERLKFTDGVLAFDTGAGEIAGTAYRIYQAAFDRVPDGGGLAYHINNLDKGASFTRMADIFVNSAEFKSVYGANVSNADYIDRLYNNVLGRDGEAGGIAFWIGQLESGARTKSEVLIGFADSPENVSLTGVATRNGVFYPSDYDVL